MPDAGGGAGLAQKALRAGEVDARLRRQHLDRHHAVQRLVERPHHDPEAAPPEDLQHVVMAQSGQAIPVRDRSSKCRVSAARRSSSGGLCRSVTRSGFGFAAAVIC